MGHWCGEVQCRDFDRELKAMGVKTKKRLTMFGAFYKKGSVPRLYTKREDGGRGLISVFDCVS